MSNASSPLSRTRKRVDLEADRDSKCPWQLRTEGWPDADWWLTHSLMESLRRRSHCRYLGDTRGTTTAAFRQGRKAVWLRFREVRVDGSMSRAWWNEAGVGESGWRPQRATDWGRVSSAYRPEGRRRAATRGMRRGAEEEEEEEEEEVV